MFDIGFLELLLIGVVGLLVLGPERLPKAARTAGMWVGRVKRSVSGIQREINEQLKTEELRQKINDQQKAFDEGVKSVNRGVESLADDERKTATSGDTSKAAQASADTSPSPEQRLDKALSKARQPTPDVNSDASADASSDATPDTLSADKDAHSR